VPLVVRTPAEQEKPKQKDPVERMSGASQREHSANGQQENKRVIALSTSAQRNVKK
jgi:hypothetical protein